MEVQAQIRGKRIEIRTENVRRLHLKVEGPLAELGRSLKVDVNGVAVRVKKVAQGDRIELDVKLGKDG